MGGVGEIKEFTQPLPQPQRYQFRLLGGPVDAPVDVGPHMGEVFGHSGRTQGGLGKDVAA